MPQRIIIYEDNTRLRQSLELLISDDKDFVVVGSYPDCDNVKTAVEEFDPQIIMMDIDMPGIGGVKGIKIIKETRPEIKVVVHTVFDDDTRIFDCICAGADAYLLKNTTPSKLLSSLHELDLGGAPMSPFVAQKVFQYFRNNHTVSDGFNLSPREIEILESLVKGNSYKMIADHCNISVDTVRKHLQNIYHKLQVNSGTEAVVKAIQHKIVRLD